MLSEIHVINDYNVELRPRMDSRVVLSASIRLTIKGKNGSMPGAFRKNWILLITSMIPCGLRVIFSLGSGHHWPFWKQRSYALLKAFQGPSSSQAVIYAEFRRDFVRYGVMLSENTASRDPVHHLLGLGVCLSPPGKAWFV